jgi:hypothetical protein
MTWRKLLFALPAVLGACTEKSGSPPEPTRSQLEGMVVGDAAAALDSNGRFRLQAPSPSETILSAERAESLATIWPRQFGGYFKTALERGHGSRIDVNSLAPCGAPLFAQGAFELPLAGVADRFTRPLGSYWLVALCSGQETMVSLAISATAVGLWIEGGQIRFPPRSGNEFIPAGVPSHWNGPTAETAEGAVTKGFPHTKKRIAEVPQLLAPNPAEALPQSAYWRLVLEDTTTLTGRNSGRRVNSKEVYVGPRRFMGRGADGIADVNIPAARQTDSLSIDYLITDDLRGGRSKAFAVRRPGFPLNLEATNPVP